MVANSVGWYIEEDILLLRQTQREDEQIKIDGIGWQVKYKQHIGGMPHKCADKLGCLYARENNPNIQPNPGLRFGGGVMLKLIYMLRRPLRVM